MDDAADNQLQPLFNPYDAVQLATKHASWAAADTTNSKRWVDNSINASGVKQRVPTITDSTAVKHMFQSGHNSRPEGWSRSNCKLVTFDNLMVLTVKVLRRLRPKKRTRGRKRARRAGSLDAAAASDDDDDAAAAAGGDGAAADVDNDDSAAGTGAQGDSAAASADSEDEQDMLEQVKQAYAWVADPATVPELIGTEL
ncbi:hypothetical protein OEZ85_008075 [Tetradesmus obliquus]|uniref:Uncharacterized protein n=1 Tax=Tetradesmus obliquus TaxID=3088 RepID=A0ABY8TJU3_TETOB|nr:hypothetical protein OEZ85_008075 [Tetradesmus obliquus]